MNRHDEIRHEIEDGIFAVWDSTEISPEDLDADAVIIAEQARKLEELLDLPPRDEEPVAR